MLDNIVTDDMRVATEVKRRVYEAQRELDWAGDPHGRDEDEDNEEEAGGERDRELLEGAEAIAVGGGKEKDVGPVGSQEAENLMDEPVQEEPQSVTLVVEGDRRGRSPSLQSKKSMMFER
jgi:hypothetical protein